jgi:hypothetical protein
LEESLPERFAVNSEEELLTKLEEADVCAKNGYFSTPEEVYERLGKKYGFQNNHLK